MLSIATRALAFWLVAVNLWNVPTPTEVRSSAIGDPASASVALLANPTDLLLYLMM